jgi:hypothetical protein
MFASHASIPLDGGTGKNGSQGEQLHAIVVQCPVVATVAWPEVLL